MSDQEELERHVLYILLDSNLPTGGFVASSGLESYAKHGFFTPLYLDTLASSNSDHEPRKLGVQDAIVKFAQASVENYARSTLGFVRDAWTVLDRLSDSLARSPHPASELDTTIQQASSDDLTRIDQLFEAMTLNHVTRRASVAQGVALLTLLTRGFAPPTLYSDHENSTSRASGSMQEWWKPTVDAFKRNIRRANAHGHLPVCWGVLTRAMGLSLDRAIHLHLYLHVRSLLSSAVRLNLIGPYASTQLLLHSLRRSIEYQVRDCQGATTGVLEQRDQALDEAIALAQHNANRLVRLGAGAVSGSTNQPSTSAHQHTQTNAEFRAKWAWADDDPSLPAVTWPLGEILMCRHDMQHTRIFNS